MARTYRITLVDGSVVVKKFTQVQLKLFMIDYKVRGIKKVWKKVLTSNSKGAIIITELRKKG